MLLQVYKEKDLYPIQSKAMDIKLKGKKVFNNISLVFDLSLVFIGDSYKSTYYQIGDHSETR